MHTTTPHLIPLGGHLLGPVRLCVALFLVLTAALPALESPWISDVFFYWYTWDREAELGSWMGGVHNTPLEGYYDSRTFRDNYRSLKIASEWGLTHHFMDYWAPGWKDENGEMRERTVMRAAERLREEGYDTWMSYYQDGENFEMEAFSKNVSEKRDVHQWLRDFARSPVWPRVGERPYQLVYARNGAPIPSQDHEAYRAWLLERYGSLGALRDAWGTEEPQAAEDIRLDYGGRGPARADAVCFAFETWRKEWASLDALVQQEFGLPGMVASFDVGYGPYRNFGFTGLAKTFSGPHSYAGIFKAPHDQDTERFIQAQVAKHYDTAFLDHFKNFYHDWDIRIPGTAYFPDPHNFDRFWTGVLMRRAEGLLHLSWNEWWEGSNLEPCLEFGKTYCQKNLLYATIMKRCFPDIRSAHRRARTAVLLNDYAFRCGTLAKDDLYRVIQALRRLNADFDLLPADLVTVEELGRFKTVVAPACGMGFGRNEEGEDVAEILLGWTRRGGRLIISHSREAARAFAVREAEPPQGQAPPRPGPDVNVFVDVGAEGDDRFILDGCSHRENWGRLPEGKFGAGTERTMRWTPASGGSTSMFFPCSPLRDHVLRFAAQAIWSNTVTVKSGGAAVGTIEIRAGDHEYEVAIPATAVGPRPSIDLSLAYQQRHVPGDKDPERFGTEPRVCNAAIDWMQFSTANVAAHVTEQRFEMPKAEVRFTDSLFDSLGKRPVAVAFSPRQWLTVDGATVASRYASGQSRDLLFGVGDGRALYVNGSFADIAAGNGVAAEDACEADLAYWRHVLTDFAETPPAQYVAGVGVGGEGLQAGMTDVLLAYNYRDEQATRARLSVPARDVPLSEAMALSVDGSTYQPLALTRNGDRWEAAVPLRYYGVYAVAHAPVRVELPDLACLAGETRDVAARVTDLTGKGTRVTLAVTSTVPTTTGRPVDVNVPPDGTIATRLPVTVADSADWGEKTVMIEVRWGGRTAYLWRNLTVPREPQIKLTPGLTAAGVRTVAMRHVPNPHGADVPARDVNLRVADSTLTAGELAPGQEKVVQLGAMAPSDVPRIDDIEATLELTAGSRRVRRPLKLSSPAVPTPLLAPLDRATPLVVLNYGDHPVGPKVVEARLPATVGKTNVFDSGGQPVVSQQNADDSSILFAAVVPARGSSVYWLAPEALPCRPPSDLLCRVEGEPGSGQARLTVENSFYRLTVSETAGGTVTSLVSLRTGRDYATYSFDMNAGRFSAPDRPRPACNTAQLIDEEKSFLSAAEGRITRLDLGTLRATVQVSGELSGVPVETVYEFEAFSDAFRIRRKLGARRGERVEETVALDTAFQPQLLRKSYPAFAGIEAEAPQIHYGWRYTDRVPELVSLINHHGFDEAISLFVERAQGIDRVRQGFWPANRPTPGPREFARVEFVSHGNGPVELDMVVRIHPGHHKHAKEWRQAVGDLQARVISSWPTKRGEPARAFAHDWWHPAWPFRAYAPTSRVGDDGWCRLRADFAGACAPARFDPTSVRLIEHRVGGIQERVREVGCHVNPGDATVSWRVDADGPWPRQFYAYFDSQQAWVKPSVSWPIAGAPTDRYADDLEKDGTWQLAGVGRTVDEGTNGSRALLFEADEGQGGPSVATCVVLRPQPRAEYRVTFRARAEGDGATLASNFYANSTYDFPQVHTPLTRDGEWHAYEVRLPTGAFPPDVSPALRLWTLAGPYRIVVDDVEVERVGAPPAAAGGGGVIRIEKLAKPIDR